MPLTWTPSPESDVVRYDIYRRDASNQTFALLSSVKGRETTHYLDGGRDPGDLNDLTSYEYTLRAVNAVTAMGAEAPPVKAVTRSVPPAPTELVASSGQPRQVALGWAVSPDEKVTGYEIYGLDLEKSATNKIGKVAGRETVAYMDRGPSKWFGNGGLGQLKDGSEYSYMITALNTANAASPFSEPVKAKTKLVPVAPTVLAATTHLPKAVKITFKPNPEKDVVQYVIDSATAADGKFRELARVEAAESGTVSYINTGEPDGAQRFYRIKALAVDTLESPWSEVMAGATKPLPPPPTDLQWQAESRTLRWTASAVPDVVSYKLWKKGFFGSELLATATNTTCCLESAQVAKAFKVLVSAIDAEGLESERSSALEVVPSVGK